jgi:hypothetical protein
VQASGHTPPAPQRWPGTDLLAPAATMAFLPAFGPETGPGWLVGATQNDQPLGRKLQYAEHYLPLG